MNPNEFELEPGITVAHFRLEKLLDRGGMSVVYLAEDLILSRRVAIKFMRKSLLAGRPNAGLKEKAELSFIRGAKSAAAINHPNIAQIYEANFETPHWYIAMEFIDGKPLDEMLIKNGPVNEQTALHIMSQVASGLQHAWESYKIIHRDIKPQNLMLSKKEQIKIVDLGLATPIIDNGEKEPEMNQNAVFGGTPYYMAPEQTVNAKVNHQADIFALGATIYEILSGKKCFRAKTPAAIYNKQLNRDYLPLTEFGVNAKLAALIDKMLHPNQQQRVTSYEELHNAIKSLNRNMIHNNALSTANVAGHSLAPQKNKTSESEYGTVITGALINDVKTVVDAFLPKGYKILNRYRILKVIGRGNSGVVYQCIDNELERACSVKRITSGKEYSPQEFPRIKQNYLKMLQRKHPNLVDIYDVRFSDDGNEIYVIMEMLKGENLLQHKSGLSRINGRINLHSIAPLLRQIATALDSVGKQFSLIHNDLKPVSIFITKKNVVKILDYGVTYLSQQDDPFIEDSAVWKHPVANPDYMSPELWQHKPLDLTADQYSFAVIIYEILSAKLPFWMRELQSTIDPSESYLSNLLEKQYNRVVNEPPAIIDFLNAAQNQALQKALAKNPRQRFPDCLSFVDALTKKNSFKLVSMVKKIFTK